MKKRMIALCLCLCMLIVCFASCASKSNGVGSVTPKEELDSRFSEGGSVPTATSAGDKDTTEPATEEGESERMTEATTVATTDAVTEEETAGQPVLTEDERTRMLRMLSGEYQGNTLPIGGWSTPTTQLRDGNTGVKGSYDAAFQLLADAGLNFMITLEEWSSSYWPLESLSSAKKAGMKLWYNCVGMEADYSLEKIRAMLESEDADALAAIYVKDEPSFDGIGEVADTLGKIREGLGEDNTLPVLANLLPTYAPPSVITSDYRNYVRTYLETVKPSLLMFDYYPYQANSGDSLPEMMVNIAIAKEEADRAGVELYTFIQSSGSNGMREPTLEEIRLNAHLNLAMGVKGFAYFLTCEHYEGWEYTNMIDAHGETTPLYDKVKTVNEELEAFKGVFLDYDNKGIMLANYGAVSRRLSLAGCEVVLDSFGVLKDAEASSGKAVIGCFEDEEGREAYYVVNVSYTKDADVTLHFDGLQYTAVWTDEGCVRADNSEDLHLQLEPGQAAFVVRFNVE